MNIQAVRSDALYRKMMGAEQIEKENIYRNELMKPFEFKWMCVGIPLKAEIRSALFEENWKDNL